MNGEKLHDWSSIWETYRERIQSEKVLVCVHPTYGRGLVSVSEHNDYLDALQVYWSIIALPVIRILVSGGFEDEVLLRYTLEPDVIISTFPRDVNLSSVLSQNTEVCGSTAKRDQSLPNGCVDNVSELLTTNRYSLQSIIVPEATLFPAYTR